jgi:BirA family transcriptional regulator, biotin operon repressor / biotin---[acetyl-CoA-carboxylase] ligase
MKNFQHPLFDEVYHYEKLISTSKQATKLINNQTAQGNFLIIANEQSGGIGRGKNTWSSPLGGIWMTAALYGLSVSSNLTIFTGICIHKALCELFPEFGTDFEIKWPNDIFLKNRKLCGILASHNQSDKYHLLGIGLNSNVEQYPEVISETAISLSDFLQKEVENEIIIAKIFDKFAADLPEFIEGNFDLKYFKQNSFLKGKEIILDTDFDQFSGLCKGINKSGAILIKLKSGMIQPFYAGSVLSWTGSQD